MFEIEAHGVVVDRGRGGQQARFALGAVEVETDGKIGMRLGVVEGEDDVPGGEGHAVGPGHALGQMVGDALRSGASSKEVASAGKSLSGCQTL